MRTTYSDLPAAFARWSRIIRRTHRSNDAAKYGEGSMRGIKTAFGLVAAIAAALFATVASAQGTLPNRPIHTSSPYPAGGIVDIVARAGDRTGRPRLETDCRRRSKARRQQQYRHISRGAQRTRWLHLAGHRASRYWSIPRSTRTPAGTRCTIFGASASRCRIKAWRWHPPMPVKTSHELVELARSKPGQVQFRQSRHRFFDRP